MLGSYPESSGGDCCSVAGLAEVLVLFEQEGSLYGYWGIWFVGYSPILTEGPIGVLAFGDPPFL